MNTARRLLGLLFFAVATGLWAQNPIVQLERRDIADGDNWTGRTPLMFRVVVLHPAMRPGAREGDFVLDPPGGWRGAIRLVVTDVAGKSVDWPFENMGKDMDQPLTLHRLGTASASFLLDPKAKAVVFAPGRYQVRARLAATAGAWRGSVDSPPVQIEHVGRAQPGLELIGLDAGPLLRGWPLLLGVRVTAPAGYDGGLSLPTEEKDWQKVIGLALIDRAGANVILPVDRLPVADLRQSNLEGRDSRTVWFRVAAESTRALGDGPFRWVANFSLPARGSGEVRWTGSVSLTTAPFAVVVPPTALTDELARRQTWAHVDDALVEAKLLRARAEGGYLNDRSRAEQQAAGPLHRAERLAFQWLDAHPNDPDAAGLVANVMAAQEDKDRAILYARRAMAADQRQRTARSGDKPEASAALSLMARGYETMPDERHAVLTPALRLALKEIRAGKLPPASNPLVQVALGVVPTTTAAAARASVPAPAHASASAPALVRAPGVAPAPPAAVVSVAPPAVTIPLMPVGPTRPGEPSPGQVVGSAELVDAKIRADGAGQWAAAARAGSEYGRTQYSAAQATGAPNVTVAGNSPDAWCPAVRNVGLDWLLVTFANPVAAVEVRVRQSDASGAITKVEAIEPDGTSHVWWEGVDPAKALAVREIVWFAVRVPQTTYPVAHVKFTLNLASGPGYKQVDAVQLVAAP